MQTTGIDLVAEIIDTTVRLRQGGSDKLESRLQRLVREERVIEGVVDADCLLDQRAAF